MVAVKFRICESFVMNGVDRHHLMGVARHLCPYGKTDLCSYFCSSLQMSSRGKRARRDEAGPSNTTPPSATPELPPAPTFNNQLRHPWPKLEAAKIRSTHHWEDSPRKETEKPECIERPISEDWDEYDTLFYNAWQKIEMRPTRITDFETIGELGITRDVWRLLDRIGLGTMHTIQYALYPDLARQFIASCRVYYAHEDARIAHEGVLTFMCKGVRFRITIPELCDVYRFPRANPRATLPLEWKSVQQFWSAIGMGRYDAKRTKQSDVVHPVLRYVLRLLSSTLLCKPDPTKLRKSELILLYTGLSNIFPADFWTSPPPPTDLNLGAIFADHLCSIKTRAFTKQTFETVGSLLTPIFSHFSIPMLNVTIISKRVTLDHDYLRHVHFMKTGNLWVFPTADGVPATVHLPHPTLTDIKDDHTRLLLTPAPDEFSPISARRNRVHTPVAGTPGASTSHATLPDIPSSSSTAFPEPPAGYATHGPTFRKYMVSTMRQMWEMIAAGATCGRPSSPSARRSQPPPTTPLQATDEDEDEDEDASDDSDYEAED